MYYKARYYDPALGRFITADSVIPGADKTQAYNRYMYVVGNPVGYNDPDGQKHKHGLWHKITHKMSEIKDDVVDYCKDNGPKIWGITLIVIGVTILAIYYGAAIISFVCGNPVSFSAIMAAHPYATALAFAFIGSGIKSIKDDEYYFCYSQNTDDSNDSKNK